MIFARYRGPSGQGNFTKGKTYFASPAMEDAGAVNFEKIHITDDDGKRVTIRPDSDRFEYPDEVYVVLLKKFGHVGNNLFSFHKFPAGSVRLANDISSDGKYLTVRGIGYIRTDALEVIDSTSLIPGMWVMATNTGIWSKIERIDESMWIRTEGSEEMVDLLEFRLAVYDGDIAMEPLVRCHDAMGAPGLTVGSVYRLVKSIDGLETLVNDDGEKVSYMQDRFET